MSEDKVLMTNNNKYVPAEVTENVNYTFDLEHMVKTVDKHMETDEDTINNMKELTRKDINDFSLSLMSLEGFIMELVEKVDQMSHILNKMMTEKEEKNIVDKKNE